MIEKKHDFKAETKSNVRNSAKHRFVFVSVLLVFRVSVELARRSTKRPFFSRSFTSRGGGQRRPRNHNWIDK